MRTATENILKVFSNVVSCKGVPLKCLLQKAINQGHCLESTDSQVFIDAFERSTTLHQRQRGKSLSTFYCSMRKQNTKIHTDFEISVCRLLQSVLMPVQYAAPTPLSPTSSTSQMMSNYCPICFCCISVFVVAASTLCRH